MFMLNGSYYYQGAHEALNDDDHAHYWDEFELVMQAADMDRDELTDDLTQPFSLTACKNLAHMRTSN